MRTFASRIVADESGATAIEYGLVAALLVVGSMGAFAALANENTKIWTQISKAVTENMNKKIS